MKQLVKGGRAFLRSREFRIAVLGCLVVSMMVCTAFAEETGTATIDVSAINDAFTTGFNSLVINSIGMLSAMTPIALTLAGTVYLVRKAMGWFKTMTK